MDVYLAGGSYNADILTIRHRYPNAEDKSVDIALLKSFYYCDREIEAIIPKLKKFMLDSGAFTFFMADKRIDWVSYINKYADFINRNQVELFLNLILMY